MIARLLARHRCTLPVLCKALSAKRRRGRWACREQDQASARAEAAALREAGGLGWALTGRVSGGSAASGLLCGWLQAACGSPCKPAVRKPASLPPRRIPQRRSRPERKAVRLACAAFRLVSPVHSHEGLGALGAQTATAQGASPQRWHRGPCPTPRRCKDC